MVLRISKLTEPSLRKKMKVWLWTLDGKADEDVFFGNKNADGQSLDLFFFCVFFFICRCFVGLSNMEQYCWFNGIRKLRPERFGLSPARLVG